MNITNELERDISGVMLRRKCCPLMFRGAKMCQDGKRRQVGESTPEILKQLLLFAIIPIR